MESCSKFIQNNAHLASTKADKRCSKFCVALHKEEGIRSNNQHAKKKNLLGIIVLESDRDLELKVAYTCYEDRWLLELAFKRYNSDECMDHTGEQGDFSAIKNKNSIGFRQRNFCIIILRSS